MYITQGYIEVVSLDEAKARVASLPSSVKWDEVKRMGVENQDEHVTKLVYCCYVEKDVFHDDPHLLNLPLFIAYHHAKTVSLPDHYNNGLDF